MQKGEIFGHLTMTGKSKKVSSRKGCKETFWHGICDCGNEKWARRCELRSGRLKSCGCQRGDVRHGKYKTPEYTSWCGMKSRCTNPGNPKYYNYGGRGVTVCDRWMNSFEAFLEDVGERPGTSYSIDRIDSAGNYEPNNVRWATRKTQAQNTRRNHNVNIWGVSMCLSEWCRFLGKKEGTVRGRIHRGHDNESALLGAPTANIPEYLFS